VLSLRQLESPQPGAQLPDGRFARSGVFVYLASKSPRRQELLRQIGVGFNVFMMREAAGRPADVDEGPLEGEDPVAYVTRIARTKAATAWMRMRERRFPEHPMVGADTTVVVDGRILGKPAGQDDARAMLRLLSGRAHDVLTAVAIAWQDEIAVEVSRSRVAFRPLAEGEIDRYVATGEPTDKAGGYGIQGRAAIFTTRLEGSYSGVMGLPLAETASLLARLGFPVL
jgi:septum formation protein